MALKRIRVERIVSSQRNISATAKQQMQPSVCKCCINWRRTPDWRANWTRLFCIISVGISVLILCCSSAIHMNNDRILHNLIERRAAFHRTFQHRNCRLLSTTASYATLLLDRSFLYLLDLLSTLLSAQIFKRTLSVHGPADSHP